MLATLYRSTVATLVFALLLCGAYPLVVTGLGQVFFADNATGGIITSKDGKKAIGARLIGQGFSKPEYFHGRPSAAGAAGYDAAASSGSNLGPTNQKLFDAVKANVDTVLKDNPDLARGSVPNDLVTASASGLDPHISPEAALVQVTRVAKARGATGADVSKLVDKHTAGPQWGVFGESVVHVLALNLDLDQLYPLRR